jgi:hypothetical protein
MSCEQADAIRVDKPQSVALLEGIEGSEMSRFDSTRATVDVLL